VHAQLVADGAEEDAIAEADRLHGIAVAAAEAAQTKANEAHEDAGTAQSTADSALTMAGSKSKVTYSTNAPAGTATVGDTHRQQNATGDIVAEWEYTADGWQKRQVSSDAISNLDVGKLTAGTTEIVEAVINKLWAELGVFNRLQAREGWIGGVNLADGAVTAEKIEATRELITRIMGAEWAYISERLVVDGDLIAANIDAISAAIGTLTVTERADFTRAFAQEMWAELGVFDKLQAAEAWIGGTLIKDGEITTPKLNVTEAMVGKFAEFLHLVVDQIDVNSLWADQIWQAAGYFGSSEADQQTRVDGTGLRISKNSPDDETTTDLVRLGGEGIGLTFQDEDGNVTGSLQHDGDATLKDVSAHSLTMAGRPLQDPACNDYLHPSGDQSLLTFRPRGVAGWNTRNMPSFTSDYREWGFMDVTANLYAGRMYRISVGPVYTFTDNTTNQLRIRYTDDGTVARIISPILGRARYGVQAGQHSSHISGEWYYIPDHSGQHSFLATIYNGQGVRLPSGYSGAEGNCWLVVEDVGLDPGNSGQDRDTRGSHTTSGINNEDAVGGIQTYTTTWTADWYQSYRNNGNTAAIDGYGAEKPRQGYRELDNQLYTSLIGFTGATDSTNTTEIGQTFQAALAGATVRSIILEVTGEYSRRQNNTFYRILTSSEPSSPPTYTPSGASPRHIANYRVDVGQTRRITLPVTEHGDSLKDGTFQAIGLSPLGNSDLKYTGGLSWNNPPKITITYQR